MANRLRKSGTRAGAVSDPRRRRLIRRVLVVWVLVTLITGMFYAYNKARARRPRAETVPRSAN